MIWNLNRRKNLNLFYYSSTLVLGLKLRLGFSSVLLSFVTMRIGLSVLVLTITAHFQTVLCVELVLHAHLVVIGPIWLIGVVVNVSTAVVIAIVHVLIARAKVGVHGHVWVRVLHEEWLHLLLLERQTRWKLPTLGVDWWGSLLVDVEVLSFAMEFIFWIDNWWILVLLSH